MRPDLTHAIVTGDSLDLWRRASKTPAGPDGRIAIFFGVSTALWFADGLDPADFDFYTTPEIGNGFLLFDRAAAARQTFADLHPTWELLF